MNRITVTFQVLGIALILLGVFWLFISVFALVAYRLAVTKASREQKRRDSKNFAVAERGRRDFA